MRQDMQMVGLPTCFHSTISRCRSGPGFGYGFIMAWCFVMAFFCLLCGLVTSGFYPVRMQAYSYRRVTGCHTSV